MIVPVSANIPWSIWVKSTGTMNLIHKMNMFFGRPLLRSYLTENVDRRHPEWGKGIVQQGANDTFSKNYIVDMVLMVWLLTHWGRVAHICINNLTINVSYNGLSPFRRQAIICTKAGILLIEPLRTNFHEILIEIHTFSFKKMHLKMSSGKWRPYCLSLNVLSGSLVYEGHDSNRGDIVWYYGHTGLFLYVLPTGKKICFSFVKCIYCKHVQFLDKHSTEVCSLLPYWQLFLLVSWAGIK